LNVADYVKWLFDLIYSFSFSPFDVIHDTALDFLCWLMNDRRHIVSGRGRGIDPLSLSMTVAMSRLRRFPSGVGADADAASL
jgi:hypothetical protein